MIEVAPNCCDLAIKTFPKDLTKNLEMTEADESQNGFSPNFLTVYHESSIHVKKKKRKSYETNLSKRLSVQEINQLLSLSLSILLAAILQTVHCFTIYMNEHIKAFSF